MPTTSLEIVRTRLAGVWLGTSALIVVLVALQSLLGKYGDHTQDAWGWLLPTIMPTSGVIVTGLVVTALDSATTGSAVRTSFYRLALSLSIFYLALVLLTILVQPLTGADALDLMKRSNLWLGPIQGLVGSALGVLFASKKAKDA